MSLSSLWKVSNDGREFYLNSVQWPPLPETALFAPQALSSSNTPLLLQKSISRVMVALQTPKVCPRFCGLQRLVLNPSPPSCPLNTSMAEKDELDSTDSPALSKVPNDAIWDLNLVKPPLKEVSSTPLEKGDIPTAVPLLT